MISQQNHISLQNVIIAIVDDEEKEMTALSEALTDYAAINHLNLTIHTYHSAEEILAVFHPYAYTAIFMDIYMKELNGIKAAEKLLSIDRSATLIFLTTSNEHMPEAFAIHAYDYISKPAKMERIAKVMDDVLLMHTQLSASPRLLFNNNGQEVSIPYHDIVAVRTAGHNYLDIISISGASWHIRMTFSTITELLGADHHFLLIIRGTIVNMDHILRMDNELCHMEGGLSLPINIKNAKALETTWQNYKITQIRNAQKTRRIQK